jgi:hypothetical protein
MAREEQRDAHGGHHADHSRDPQPARRPPAALREIALEAGDDPRPHALAQILPRSFVVSNH